jgi:hypothetical protein
VLSATLKQGECIFVPAFYWVQSESRNGASEYKEMTTIVNFEYETHSELLNLLFQAIDQGILEN